MKKKETYKTEHPTIKEITIGDKFVLNDGTMVTFHSYRENNYGFNYFMELSNNKYYLSYMSYNRSLEHSLSSIFNIKQRYIPLKDKIDLL